MKYSHNSTSDDWSWLDELGELDPSFIEAIQQLHAATNLLSDPRTSTR